MKRSIRSKTITIDTEYLEFLTEPRHNRVTVFLVRGYEDAAGFHEMEREVVVIEGVAYEKLRAPNAQGKRRGRFRNDDVLAAVDKIRGAK